MPGATNVEFLKGRDRGRSRFRRETVDVVISNCVVNLSPDKEARPPRDLPRPEGRADGSGSATSSPRTGSTPEERAERGGWAGCIAGALSVGEYRRFLEEAGFADVDIRFTHEVADGLHGAIVRGVKPADALSVIPALAAAGGAAGCC